jgi:TolB-like protein
MPSAIPLVTAAVRRLTLLLVVLGAGVVGPQRASAQDSAVARGDTRGGEARDGRKTVAVLYFANHTGVATYDALGKGIAEMLITDLSSLPSLRLVERARLEELMAEATFSRGDHADPRTAMEIGRVLAAQYVVTGAFTGIDPELRLDGRLIRTETAEILRSAQAQGTADAFFQIHEDLVGELLPGLELALSQEEWDRLQETRERNRIADAETVLAYSQALDHYDRGDYLEALELMAFVARRASTSALVDLTLQHVQAAARDHAREAVREEARSWLGRFIRGIRGGS